MNRELNNMRTLCDQLLIQVKQLVEEKNNMSVELSLDENKAIQRITRISKSLNSTKIAAQKKFDNNLLDFNVSEDIRFGLCDGNLELYQKLSQHTRSKLERISPESLLGYVALLD
ncbi:MAG: hypothetical protein V7776_13915 [Halopseudomonas aestusnigri]